MNTYQTVDVIAPRPIRIRARMVAVVRSVKELCVAIFELLCQVQADYEMRQRMRQLDNRMLLDIGVTREDVEAAAKMPFWCR